MNRNGAEKLRFTIGIYAMMLVSAFCTSAQGTLLSDCRTVSATYRRVRQRIFC